MPRGYFGLSHAYGAFVLEVWKWTGSSWQLWVRETDNLNALQRIGIMWLREPSPPFYLIRAWTLTDHGWRLENERGNWQPIF